MDERRPEPRGEPQDLRDLVAQCLSRMDREGEGALEALCAEHPGEAAKLRDALARLGGLGLVAERAAPQEAPPEELGEFELVRKIGEGGMGVVYLARQKSLQREVALKLIRPDRLGLGISRERFVREIETIARLSHPGIVPIYAAGEDKGLPYYAMELLSGSTLEEVIERVGGKSERGLSGSDLYAAVRGNEVVREEKERIAEGWFSASWTELALRIASQVAEALQHAHERGVLHRDVKPSNVMLTRDGRALLLDFGLATRDDAQKLTRSGAAVGSLPYMAPEQHRAEALDARTDVYALGLVLYELLTLRSPYLGATVEETRRRVLDGAAEPIRKCNPAVPWDVQTVCAKAMDREPERRYPSMAAFASDLRSLLELRPIAAAPPSRWLLARRWAQRRPGAAASLAIATLALLAGIPFFLWNDWRYRREIERERDAAVFERGRAQVSAAQAEEQRELAEANAKRADEQRELAEVNAKRADEQRELAEANAKRADEQRTLAVANQARAEAQAARAAAVLAFQRRMFRSADPGENGRDVKVVELLHMAALEADSGYAGQPEVEAAVRLSLGETFAALSLLDEAEEQFRAALALLDGVEGAEPRDRAALEFQLGRVRFSQDQLDEAERLLESARAAYVATEGEGSRNAATVELELASLMRARSKVNESLERVAAVCERLDRTLGDGDRATLDAWGQYGQILALAGQQARAEQVLRETIAKKQKLFAPESPDLLVTRINLANVLYQLEKHAEAHALAKEVREIQERVLGPDHAHTLVSLSTEATTLGELNDLAGAAKLERDLWERRSRVLGPDHADTLRSGGNLASTLAGLGEDAESERITREILEKRLRVLGPEHWETGASHNHLASLLQKRNDFAAAHEHLVRAVVCARASFEGDHWIIGAFLNNLGRCETNLARYAEAERSLLEAHAVLEKVLPAGHARIHSAIRNLVALYEKSGNAEQRAAWAAKLPPQ